MREKVRQKLCAVLLELVLLFCFEYGGANAAPLVNGGAPPPGGKVNGAARAPGAHYLLLWSTTAASFACNSENSAGHLSRQSFIVCATEYTAKQRDREHAGERKKNAKRNKKKTSAKKKRNCFDEISEKLKQKKVKKLAAFF